MQFPARDLWQLVGPPSVGWGVGGGGGGGWVGGGVEHLNAQLEKGSSDPPLQSADSLCDCQEPLDRDRHHDEDRAAETQPGKFNFGKNTNRAKESSPVKRIVEVGKDTEEVVWVELLVVVSHLK